MKGSCKFGSKCKFIHPVNADKVKRGGNGADDDQKDREPAEGRSGDTKKNQAKVDGVRKRDAKTPIYYTTGPFRGATAADFGWYIVESSGKLADRLGRTGDLLSDYPTVKENLWDTMNHFEMGLIVRALEVQKTLAETVGLKIYFWMFLNCKLVSCFWD